MEGGKPHLITENIWYVPFRPLFTGKLCISGIYLARSLGHNKKTLKHEVYDEAMKVLTQKTVAEINELRDPGMDSLK